MSDPTVELVGDFTPDEAQFLWDTFDHCRIELLARSRRSADLALVRWTPAPASRERPPQDGGCARVSDPSRIPVTAYYVLERRARDFALTRVDSGADLESKYPGQFDASLIPDRPKPTGCLPGLLIPFGKSLG
ncbi:MAG: hypothetical protein FJ029_01450 [Actinobacteria bacterium]|nr:hypothetical protein [Actinomycetota bacterium]